MEAMKKIIEAERQASSLVTEARVYKTMLLNQTRKKAEEQAQFLLSEAERISRTNEEAAAQDIKKIADGFSSQLKALEDEMKRKVADKKIAMVKDLITEVKHSDR
ncbi:MAG: hypothetical protein WC344_02615 [Bacilli bacterium]